LLVLRVSMPTDRRSDAVQQVVGRPGVRRSPPLILDRRPVGRFYDGDEAIVGGSRIEW
jgi:hypothetical protein